MARQLLPFVPLTEIILRKRYAIFKIPFTRRVVNNSDKLKQRAERIGDFVILESPSEDPATTPVSEKQSAIQQVLDELRADRSAHETAITKRLETAIAKEEALQSLLEAQKSFIAELLAEGVETGDLIGPAEAAKSLDLSPRSLRWYADEGIIPCVKIGRHRKYNLKEIKDALEQARKDGRAPRLTAAERKRILR